MQSGEMFAVFVISWGLTKSNASSNCLSKNEITSFVEIELLASHLNEMLKVYEVISKQ